MGQTPRAAEANYRARQRREWDDIMRAGKPDSLTEAEVNLATHPLTKAPEPRPVAAWVRYGSRAVWVKGFTSMWTDAAAKVRWTVPQGGWHEAWVWSGAVEPRQVERSEEHGQEFGTSINAARMEDLTPENRRARGLADR